MNAPDNAAKLYEILAAADPDESVSTELLNGFVSAVLAAGWLPDQTDYELKHMTLVERMSQEALALDLFSTRPAFTMPGERAAYAKGAELIRAGLLEMS